MNAKTAKLLRKYCKVYGRNYHLYKKNFERLSVRQQFKVIVNLKGALKPKSKKNGKIKDD